jgi:predicted  nucleic acid-binding Zn-ribbon protein
MVEAAVEQALHTTCTDSNRRMAISAELLETLHRIHRQLGDLRDRQERGPRQVRAREANVAKIEAELAAAQDAVKQAKMTADRKQLDLKASELKIAEWKVKLNACASNKEYQTLVDQIAAGEMAGSVLADEILEGMEKTDQLETAVTEVKSRLEASKTDLAKVRDAVVQEGQVVAGDIQRLDAELAEAEKQLPADFRDDYRRVIRAKGADGMARVVDGVCDGCGQQVQINRQNQLLLSKAVFCTACGRLLYRSER